MERGVAKHQEHVAWVAVAAHSSPLFMLVVQTRRAVSSTVRDAMPDRLSASAASHLPNMNG